MDLKLIGETETRITLQIENADFSVSDILHNELLKESKVEIAGVLSPHPLLNQQMIKFELKKNSNPVEILLSSSKRAKNNAALILQETRNMSKVE